MSVYATIYVWQKSEQKGRNLLLLLALADYANQESGKCWPSLASLARMCRSDVRSIRRKLRELEKSGEILVEQGTGRGRTNHYTIVGYREWYQDFISSRQKRGSNSPPLHKGGRSSPSLSQEKRVNKPSIPEKRGAEQPPEPLLKEQDNRNEKIEPSEDQFLAGNDSSIPDESLEKAMRHLSWARDRDGKITLGRPGVDRLEVALRVDGRGVATIFILSCPNKPLESSLSRSATSIFQLFRSIVGIQISAVQIAAARKDFFDVVAIAGDGY